MDASNLQTPVELIVLDQELIERKPPETRTLWLVVMAFVQQLLGSIDEFRKTIATLNQTILALQAETQKLKQARKTPRNSSVPPSTEHPHAKLKSAGSRQARLLADSRGILSTFASCCRSTNATRLSNSFSKSVDAAVRRWISSSVRSIH